MAARRALVFEGDRSRYAGRPLLILLPLLAGCSGIQSTLDPRGPAAAKIAELWWLMFWGGLGVFALVFGLFLLAFLGRRRGLNGDRFIALLGIGLPVAVLTALLVHAFLVGERILRDGTPPDLVVEVIGQRWWWEVRYPRPGASGAAAVVTANEIHVPAGRSVEFAVSTRDVIHSFWVPNLGGKIDLIPGRVNRIRLQADAPGVFRGQCAEFCGAQHARMALRVVAHPPGDFDAWLERQRLPAAEPAGEPERRGREIFRASDCAECHTVRGTRAQGREGPDLTHLASRAFIAAGTLRNDPESLMAWVRSNQSIKPGNRMREFPGIVGDELRDLAAYLGSLK